MVHTVPLGDAYGDSPAFQSSIHTSEASLNNVDSSIKKMGNIAEKIVELTKDYSAKFTALAEELHLVAGNENDPSYEVMGQQLFKFAQVFKDIERSRMIAASQFKDTFIDPLAQFAATEINPTKKVGKEYQNAQDNYLNAMGKYMGKRPHDKGIEESVKDVVEARKAFHLKAVEYGIRLNDVEVKRKYEVMERIISLAYTNSSFYHQGYDAFKDIEPSMRDLTAVLQKMRVDHTRASTPQPSSFQLPDECYDPTSVASESKSTRTATAIYKAGYLYKKSSSKMRTDDAKTTIDLRICMVKETPTPERRFCFDLVSPAKTMTLQAQNDEQLKDWIGALQAAIAKSISEEGSGANSSSQKLTFGDPSQTSTLLQSQQSSSSTGATAQGYSSSGPAAGGTAANQLFSRVAAVPGNDTCADCDSTVDVEWASCNLGIVVCITCSGIHRGLGRHVSKVKSLSLDRWDPEGGEVLLLLGNRRVNEIFEGGLEVGEKPTPNDDRARKEKYCAAKYKSRSFLASATPSSTSIPPLTKEHLPQLLKALAYGRNVNEADPTTGRTLLHRACEDPVVVEFLLAWGADAELKDEMGWTPLHSAADAGAVNSVLAFLRRTARVDLRDNAGRLPIDLARALSQSSPTHAHIVSLLGGSSSSTSTPQISSAETTVTTTVNNAAGVSQHAAEGEEWASPPSHRLNNDSDTYSATSPSAPLKLLDTLPRLPSTGHADPWSEEQAQWGT
ncbi:Arf-GAP with coiled-coil, ANK repeat and PH domain-containing protein 2 [Geranomyces michiganensis]|nr:Arf-GAP with coiled-coil, ANK repeat and PH domain-containing protein 2 [Geranomyces michiganensis]